MEEQTAKAVAKAIAESLTEGRKALLFPGAADGPTSFTKLYEALMERSEGLQYLADGPTFWGHVGEDRTRWDVVLVDSEMALKRSLSSEPQG